MLFIRHARPEDERFLLPIHLATWTAAVSPGPAPHADDRVLDEATALEDVLVAEVGGEVIGYVRLHQPGPLPSHAHALVINGLAVDPARQREGVGRRLLDAALAEAGRRGATKVSLRVLASNAKARRLYEACGFHVEGVLAGEFRLSGEHVDDVLMACHMAAGSVPRAPMGAVVRDYLRRVVNEHDLTAVDELVSPRYCGSGHGWPADAAALRAFYRWQSQTRPDWSIEVQETVELGGSVVVRAHAGGTITADETGRPLAAPTTRAVEWLALYRIEAGLIVEIQVLSIQDRT